MATQTVTTPHDNSAAQQPGSPTHAGVAPDKVEAGSPTRAAVAHDGVQDIITFLARYLYCTEHQRTLLALWILHTHCFAAAEVTPYLAIQSALEQSGKTRSLQLLSLLCPNPALTASFATNSLSSRIHYAEHRPTFLLDECHATIGSRNRSKNPILRAILTSGFHRGLGHTDRKGERVIFSPKAFAGIGPLPHALAERSIPIHLEQLNNCGKLKEFRSEQAQAEAQPLREWLAQWAEENLQKLKSVPTLELKEFPAGIPLTPRRQDMLKPLLHIAKVLAGEWPRRAATALTQIFKDDLNRERKHVLDLLFELREAFSHYGQPDRLATASLLAWLHLNPDAAWNQEGPITATRLSNLLRPFNIRPGLKYKDKKHGATHRGYTLQSFLYTWNTLLPPEPLINDDTSRREPMPNPILSSQTSEATVRAALETAATAASVEDHVEVPSVAEMSGQELTAKSQKPSIHAGPSNLTTTREVSASPSKSALAGAPTNSSEAIKLPTPTASGVAVVTSQELIVADPGVPRTKSQKPSVYAAGNNVATTGEVSASASKSSPQSAPSTSRTDVPKTVPNPQPIPFPSKAELEKQGYRFGPFSREHNPLDVAAIAHYAKQGYRPLQPHEVDYAEFRCNGVPFGHAASVPHRTPPPEPPKPQKSPEEVAREELTAWLRKEQQSLPKCAERENVRLAPTKRR